jgi:NADH-quinone oxidoreductase subunit G
VSSAHGSVVLPARVDASLASNVLRVPAAHPLTVALGAMSGRLELALERADAAQPSVA